MAMSLDMSPLPDDAPALPAPAPPAAPVPVREVERVMGACAFAEGKGEIRMEAVGQYLRKRAIINEEGVIEAAWMTTHCVRR